MNIIGIDSASQEENTGLALGSCDKQISIIDVARGSKDKTRIAKVSEWLSNNQPTLLAFDAPLGWPIELSTRLIDHNAGQLLDADPKILFSRETDRILSEKLGKRPLEVGANYIARTTHSSLALLNDLRNKHGEIPLAWAMGNKVTRTCAIEVYPAGTLKSRGIEIPRKNQDDTVRQKLLEKLHINTASAEIEKEIIRNRHIFDAVICVLAAADFLNGECISIPDDKLKQAQKEGWIWVRNPATDPSWAEK